MTQAELTPWLGVAGLGAFHGLNPAMGWLFAVALGLHRHRRSAVILALVPILIGHALAIAVVLYAAIGLDAFLHGRLLNRLAGVALIGWALWHAVYGHRRRVRVGMRTGLLGLGGWSFLMASAHGAGLMLLPFALPICTAAGATRALDNPLVGLGVVAAHTGAMLLVIAVVAMSVYEWVGLGFLRKAWVNVDLVWSLALVASGLYLLLL